MWFKVGAQILADDGCEGNHVDTDGIRPASGTTFGGGATVKLVQSTQTIATVTTNAAGQYSVANVVPGTYSVEVVAPSGYSLSPRDQGTDNTADSDADPATASFAV